MTPAAQTLRGIAAMVISQLAMIFNDTLVKLAGDALPMGEIIFIRGLFCTLIFVTASVALGLHRSLPRLADRRVLGRLAGEIGGTYFYLVALFQMPIANVVIIFQAVPLVATAGAALLLGEAVGWRRWSAILVGFLGVLLVVRPGLSGFDAHALLVLVSVLFIAARDLFTRAMSTTLPILLVAGLTALSVTIMGGAMGLSENWIWPSPLNVLQLAGAALLLGIGYFMVILAMRLGDIGMTAPFRYVTVLFAITIGFFIWGDVPDELTLIGSAIIVATGIYALYRERRRKGIEAAPEAAPATVPPPS